MLGRTHLAIGLAATTAIITNPQTLPASLVVAGVSSLIPDIDEEHSIIRHRIDIVPCLPLGFLLLFAADYFLWHYKYFSLLTAVLFAIYISFGYFAEHRSFTHSLLGFITFILILALSAKILLIPAVIGYGLHLAADLMTNTGIELLYPARKRFGLHLINTGSIIDRTIELAAGLLFFVMLYQSLAGMHILFKIFPHHFRTLP
ncbi:inner membrane protein [Thermoanaerobacter thermohydrosulfuricus]|uniref:Inner membrane protein n=1 Tax=Thermoanaerobacter thermohydrosulfuricus TaxID=1516 RepID=A0A1G7IX88_THETY|nr:metal-dependent hydrolase [Thermoanaerobacter thermohydrosulfuricus]SDF17164.1 inner membrane protein [Thermoanaerobacter thermohydrosulfuricus]